ncbi:hypothetical protein TMEC54S_03516 [Thauera mechernichensis]
MTIQISPRALTDSEKQEIIKCSIVNLGRLLADGMELYFYREGPGAPARLEMAWPDGTDTTVEFVGCSPVYSMPMVAAVNAAVDELRG